MKEKWKDFVQFVKDVNPKDALMIHFPTDNLEELRFALKELTKQAFFENLKLDLRGFQHIESKLLVEIFNTLSQFPHLRYIGLYYNAVEWTCWNHIPKPPSLIGVYTRLDNKIHFFNRAPRYFSPLNLAFDFNFNPIPKRKQIFYRFHKASQVYRKVMINKLQKGETHRIPNELTEMVLTSAFKVKKNIMRSLCHKTGQSTIKFKALIHCGFDITYRKLDRRTKYWDKRAYFSFK